MIDFRYHIVSIVAIFFALGAGVLLGSGPLKSTGTDLVASQAQRDRKSLDDARAEIIELKTLDKYRDEYVGKVTSPLTFTKLKDRKIAVVTMPQVEESVVEAVSQALQDAGGQVNTRVSLNEKLFDPEQQQLVDPLVNQLITADVDIPKDSNTFQRAGVILARGIAAKEEGATVDDNATKVLSGLNGSKMFSFKPTPKDRASLVVVIAGKPPTPKPENAAYEDAVDLVQGLDLASAGVVLAGTPESAVSGGLLKAMRGDSDATKAVSSVDVANLPSGQATVVFSLVEQAEDKAGQYGGIEAKDGVAPKAMIAPES